MTIPTLKEVLEQVEKLSPEDKQHLIDYLQGEIEFENQLIEQAIGNNWKSDGSIDFDKLYKHGKSAHELNNEYPDVIDEDGHIGNIDE